MRIVALNAGELFDRTMLGIPMTVFSTVYANSPIAISGSVAFRAECRGLIARDFRSIVVDEDIGAFRMVTVQAVVVESMSVFYVGVFDLEGGRAHLVTIVVVTHRALVGVAVTMEA